MLGNKMRKYVMGEEKRKHSKAVQNVYNYRIRRQGIRALSDLALLAEKLPETRLDEIFNEKTLTPLMRNLFTLFPDQFKPKDNDKPKGAKKPKKTKKPAISKEELEKRRKRILALSHITLEEIGNEFNASNLAPDIMQALTEAGPQETLPTIKGLKAIYIKTLHQQ